MNIEKELIENIKAKDINKIKIYFNENNIISENFNNFKNTLFYFIQNDTSIEIIHFIIKQQNNNNHNNNIDILFYSVQHNKFKIANLLLKTKTHLNEKNN